MHYVIVDIETTGGSPKQSKITEIAIYKHNGIEVVDQYETLINPEVPIPDFIVNLTGISDQMVEGAPRFYEIAKDIIEFTEGCVFVAHNVNFDYGVLRYEFRQLGYDYRRRNLCTVVASRKVLPGHDSYSLGKLTRALGISLIGRHRAGGDAFATAKLFTMLMETNHLKLIGLIQEDLNPKILHPNLDLAELEEIPDKTGVYKFFNEFDQLIYVGKSKHIRRRIDQHLKNNKTKKGEDFVKEIVRIEYEVTGSEFIASLVEDALLKTHQPPFNGTVRKTRFSHGLFHYTDDTGYIHLFIAPTARFQEQPLLGFGSKKEGVNSLEGWVKQFGLCQKLCDLYTTSSSCLAFAERECKGACLQKEDPTSYNDRVKQLMQELLWTHENFYLIEAGRQKGEKSIVLVERGGLVGYGYAPFHVQYSTMDKWKKYIETSEAKEDGDFRTNLRLYLKAKPLISVFRF
jgi:DNA polymerase III subunit epsilon